MILTDHLDPSVFAELVAHAHPEEGTVLEAEQMTRELRFEIEEAKEYERAFHAAEKGAKG